MSYSNSNKVSYGSSSSTPELKLYQAFIFSVPICFTFIILFFFYLIYLRRRTSSDFSSLGIRTTSFLPGNSLSTAELGLSKELREMLPIVVFRESFSVMDSLCSVCLGDYQADDKLQQIPACKHTFHMDCIDLWLTSHTTCPLCRLTLIPSLSDRETQEQEEDHHHVPRLSSHDGGVSSQAETHPEIHGNVDQEQQCDSNECGREGEGFKEMQEHEGNSAGSSNGCYNCRIG
ncbi:unnamed protein product [Cochlearia groenlandica]